MLSLCRLLQRNLSSSAAATNVRSLSRKLYNERGYKFLVQNFNKASGVDHFRTKDGIYELAVRRFASSEKFSLVEQIRKDPKKYFLFYSEDGAAMVMRVCGNGGRLEDAQKLFDILPEINCTRTVVSFNSLLFAYLACDKFDMVGRLFKELPAKLSIEPDFWSYFIVIRAFCEMGSFDSAIAMLDEMEKKGVNPCLTTFNTLLYGLYVNGRFSDGDTIWSQMLVNNVIPDICSYNAKLAGLTGQKNMKDVVNEKNVDEAKKWYHEIKNTGCYPDNRTFELLIPFLCENGDLDSASEVCKDTFWSAVHVEKSIVQLVVDKLAEKKGILEAKKLVKLGEHAFNLSLPEDK